MEPTEKKKKSILDTIWQIFARSFLAIASLIFILYGLDGLIGGDILPGAGRKFGSGYDFPKTPNGSPMHLTGIAARLYGLVFVVAGSFFFLLVTGLLGRIENWYRNK